MITVASGCSGGSSSASRGEAGSDAGVAAAAAQAPVPVPAPLPLGAPDVDSFYYRRGPGRDDYDRAVAAEKAARDDADWDAVIASCRAALAADPKHLDAAWLLAAALARRGAHDQILAPLSQAVAGDWGKWGERSLTLPLFGDFLASRWGAAWKELAEQYRAAFAESARRSVIVLGRDDRLRTEVYAFDPATARWLRLTRTGGTVVATLPGPAGSGLIAYVAYRDLVKGIDRKEAVRNPRVAVVDLASGRVSRELAFPDSDSIRLGWKPSRTDDPLLLATVGADTYEVDWKREHKKLAKKATPSRDAVIVKAGKVRRVRIPVADITADYDDAGVASAIRLDPTRKTISPPAGLVIDGHSLAWSPDRARLALVATPEDSCDTAPTLFVVDAATGKLHSLATAAAPAPLWVDPTHLAYTADRHVLLVDVTSSHVDADLTSSGGIVTATLDRACATASTEALFAAPSDDPTADDDETPPPAAPDAGP